MLKSAAEKKRQTPRYPVELQVEFRAKQKTIAAQLFNIGTGGMCIKTADVLPVKSHSFFHIVTMDQGIHFNIEAEVVWSQPQSRIRQRRNKRPGMMGVRFIKSRYLTDEVIQGLLNSSPVIAAEV